MKNNQLISIIVPIYNASNYLDSCLESICNQTYKNLDIILVDDNSNDSSMDIMNNWSLKDSRIRIFRNDGSKHGTPVVRNIGLSKAKGDLIAFCDDDDTMKPEMLQRLYELKQEYSAQIACCSRELISDWAHMEWEDKGIQVFQNGVVNINQLANKYDVNLVWEKLYDKALFRKEQFPEDMVIGDDLYIMPALFEQCETIVYTSERLYNYSYRHNNATFTIKFDDKRQECNLRAYQRLFEYSVNNNCEMSIPINSLYEAYVECFTRGSRKFRGIALATYKKLYIKYNEYLSKDKRCYRLFHFPKCFISYLLIKTKLIYYKNTFILRK